MATNVIEDYLPMVNVSGLGPCVVVPTTKGIKFSDGVTLRQALDAMHVQLTESAKLVAKCDVAVEDMKAWLTSNFDYQPVTMGVGDSYLSPLFAELPKVPSVRKAFEMTDVTEVTDANE